jgi:hypothetical protein
MTDCHVAKDRETGSSRGFAFVTHKAAPQTVGMLVSKTEQQRLRL